MFKDWVYDSDPNMDTSWKLDIMVWKIPVLIGKKAPEDYDGVVKALRKNYLLLQYCFKNLICTQYFPNVVSKTFWAFL